MLIRAVTYMLDVVRVGDTLFVGGCGRFFEGSPQQMYTALVDILGQLPGHTVRQAHISRLLDNANTG